MDIRIVAIHDILPIRHHVLWPDKPISFCQVEGDDSATHYGVYVKEELVCVASIYIKEQTARLRKFATLADFQGRGIGSQLITHILNELKRGQITCFWCDARETAHHFYEKFKMEIQGPVFKKSGVSYYKMQVRL